MIGRRRFVASSVAALALGSSASCRTPPARPIDFGFDEVDPAIGHRLRAERDAFVRAAAGAPPRRVDVAIVGGGIAGLAAARALRQAGIEDLLVVDLGDSLGGTSAGGASAVTGYPWGAHYLPVPHADDEPLVALLGEMGMVDGVASSGRLAIREPYLVRAPETRIFEHGRFHPGERSLDGAARASRDAFARWDEWMRAFGARRDSAGRRAFDLPVDRSSDDPELLALDRISARRYLRDLGVDDERLLRFLAYGVRDDFGCSLDTVSAWALVHYHAARTLPGESEPPPPIAFPDGNHGFVAHLARDLGGRTNTSVLAIDVHEEGDQVVVLGVDVARGAPFRIVAERAIVTTPKFVAARVVSSVRDDASRPFGSFGYAPWVVTNLHLDRRPATRGTRIAWDTILAGGESLGYVTATHQRGADAGPTVLTHYRAFVDADPDAARARLLASSAEAIGRAVLDDLRTAHPDIDACVQRVDVRRHGHAMIRPVPGFLTSAARLAARRPRGRVHFANTDDSGMALFEEAFAQGMRAGAEVAAALHA